MKVDYEAARRRLIDAIEQAKDGGRSYADISRKAGRGPAWIQQFLKEGHEPRLGNFIAVCDALGVSPVKILLGIEVSSEDEDLFRLFINLPSTRRRALLAFLDAPDREGPEDDAS